MDHHSRKTWCFLLFLWIQYSIGLYLFTTGFFLTRYEITNISSCAAMPPTFDPTRSFHFRGHESESVNRKLNNECWMEKRFDRAILIIIDALRFDFADYREEEKGPPKAGSEFFLNHLPILHNTLTVDPEHSLLYKFQADAPTMTMQRLKGLTTGSLPTFLDIKDNMHSTEIFEDNLIKQIAAQGQGIVFMGDDTWMSLYGNYFLRNYSYDSFNVKDLDTVDNGVTRHLFPEMHSRDWTLLIAHFLGVDHVGHTFGPEDVHMQTKLEQMNDILSRVMDQVENDTLLIVMGDHGMSADGNHGGATDDETGAALFLYSPDTALVDLELLPEALASPEVTQRGKKEVFQVDFVPTISLLLGLPIPFGNLGQVIPEVFFFHSTTEDDEEASIRLKKLGKLNEALALNVHQVRQYLQTYVGIARMDLREIESLEFTYQQAQVLARKVAQTNEDDKDAPIIMLIEKEMELTVMMKTYLTEALVLGRKMWTQFDFILIGWGLVILVLALVVNLTLMRSSTVSVSNIIPPSKCMFILCIVTCLTYLWCPEIFPTNDVARWACVGTAGSQVTFLHSCERSTHYSAVVDTKTLVLRTGALVIVVLHTLCLFSNSFIVMEDRVFTFLCATTGLMLCFASTDDLRPSLLFLTCSRFPSIYATRPNVIHTEISIDRTIVPLVVLWFLFVHHGYPRHPSRSTKLASMIGFSLCLVYWTNTTWQWIPQLVYALSSIAWWVSVVRGTPVVGLSGCILLPLLLVLGPTSCATLLSFILQLRVLCHSVNDGPSLAIFVSIVCSHYFFQTGHDNTFTSLQNAAAFVGFDSFSFYISGSLLGLNTFGVYLLGLCGFVGHVSFHSKKENRAKHVHLEATEGASSIFTIVGYFGLNAVLSTVFVAIQRRHLFVWAIFAPKFIFDGVILLFVNAVVVLLVVIHRK